jgi:hypothetical protein
MAVKVHAVPTEVEPVIIIPLAEPRKGEWHQMYRAIHSETLRHNRLQELRSEIEALEGWVHGNKGQIHVAGCLRLIHQKSEAQEVTRAAKDSYAGLAAPVAPIVGQIFVLQIILMKDCKDVLDRPVVERT